MNFKLELIYGPDASTRDDVHEKLTIYVYNEENYFNTIKKIRELFNI